MLLGRERHLPSDLRNIMWKGKSVSIIFPTYNEKDSIKAAIEDFFASGYVDEIIVVNNNAVQGTHEEVAKTEAKEVFEKKQGYGYSLMKGLDEATGDIIILSEPDGTFLGRDVIKLLAYSDDFESVFGTRTSTSLIGEGANMGLFLKWGNVFLAKIIEVFYNTTLLTDVGCTMRLIDRKSLDRIRKYLTVGDSHFGVQMMLVIIRQNVGFIEVPLNYKKRVGESTVTGSTWKAFVLGVQMLGLIVNYKFIRQ
jgi:glycosyltransferase involved in cell wall biosynthesis